MSCQQCTQGANVIAWTDSPHQQIERRRVVMPCWIIWMPLRNPRVCGNKPLQVLADGPALHRASSHVAEVRLAPLPPPGPVSGRQFLKSSTKQGRPRRFKPNDLPPPQFDVRNKGHVQHATSLGTRSRHHLAKFTFGHFRVKIDIFSSASVSVAQLQHRSAVSGGWSCLGVPARVDREFRFDPCLVAAAEDGTVLYGKLTLSHPDCLQIEARCPEKCRRDWDEGNEDQRREAELWPGQIGDDAA